MVREAWGKSAEVVMRKAVITAAGLGTRLLSVTKAQPKEMLPVFARGKRGGLCMKPIVQLVFEDLYQVGFRDFCFIVGRGQRTLQDHFTPDSSFMLMLDKRGKNGLAEELRTFYQMIQDSNIVWVNQPEPRGFGDAVNRAKEFVSGDRFVVHAGDSYFISRDLDHLRRLLRDSELMRADATFLVQQVDDPRQYGVVEPEVEDNGTFHVKSVVEKPESPTSKLAIMPVYVFQPAIFDALGSTPLGYGGELQLTDAIQTMINLGLRVRGIDINSHAVRLDVGSPESYWQAQLLSYRHSVAEGSATDSEGKLMAVATK